VRPAPGSIGGPARCLTGRDRAVLRAVERFRVLTTMQVARLFFDSHKRASARLLDLLGLGMVERFRPYREGWGSHPWHWVLGREGAAILAAERGDPDTPARRWRGGRALAYASGQRLAHLVGVNDFHACLAGHARRHPESRLVDWMTAAEAARWCDRMATPDGWGRWEEWGRTVEFFLEYDRGTEALLRLADKLEGYERLESERGESAWVLFAFESARRERTARAALADATVPVATAAMVDGTEPQEAVWLPLRSSGGRLRLASLADARKPQEALARCADGGHRAWWFDRSAERARDEAGGEW
jgi:hypothetical protein